MKVSKLKGFLKDLENQNKKFSYSKSMKILDVTNYIYIDMIKELSSNNISDYKNSKYFIKEIYSQFEIVYDFLNKGNVLVSVVLLRNIYEEIMYIMATSVENVEVNVKSNPRDFRKVVEANFSLLLSDYFEVEDINEIYTYLSKITHVTNLKEAFSYLSNSRKYNKYIANEIKIVVITIEYMYINFLHNILNVEESELCLSGILIMGYLEIINILYFTANADNSNKILSSYFIGEKNQKYISERNAEMTKILKDFKIHKDEAEVTINKALKIYDEELKDSKYLDKANEILNNKN